MLTTRNFVAGCLPALLFACSTGDDDDGTIPPAETLHARIQDGMSLYTSSGSVTVTGAAFDREGQAILGIVDGELDLGVGPDGELFLAGFEVALEDVHVKLHRYPLHITRIHATLPGPVPAEGCWNTRLDDVTMTGSMDLFLDWALALEDGGVLPLARQRIEGVAIDVHVFFGADQVMTIFGLRRDGVFWDWAGIARLSDLSLWMMASEHDYSVEP